MKKEEKEVRRHFVKTRMNDNELARVIELQKKTTERDVSSYLRRVALQKPVVVTYRNRSADDFLKEMLPLKKELSVSATILTRQCTNSTCWIRYQSSGLGLHNMMACKSCW